MKLNIITEQLSKKLNKESKLQKYNIVNPTNFQQLHQLLTTNKINEIKVIDATTTNKNELGAIISLQDHINRTGKNILEGKQKLLDRDFIDMATLYRYKKNSIITNCCGESLNKKYE